VKRFSGRGPGSGYRGAQAIRLQAAAPVPIPIEVCHQRAEMFRFLEGEPLNLVSLAGSKAHHVITQRLLETPLGFRALAVWLRGIPATPVRAVLLEILGHAFAAVQELLLGGTARGAVLEHVAPAHPGGRPSAPTIHQNDGPPGVRRFCRNRS
jgi:hypothetical protein